MTDLEQTYQMRGLAHLVFGGPGGTDPADPQPPAPGSTEDDTEAYSDCARPPEARTSPSATASKTPMTVIVEN